MSALALAAAGCGGDDSGDTTPATTNTPAPTTNAEPTVTTPPGTVESQPGGAGDEEAAVVPATFRITGDAATPADVAVPAFFTIRVTGVSSDGKAHTIAFEGQSAEVPAGGRASFDVEGLRAGTYPVAIDGRPDAATITAGQEPGP